MWDFIHNYDGSIDWFTLIFLLVVCVVILFVVLVIIGFIVEAIGFAMAPYQHEKGIVTNKYYKGESVHPGFGLTSGGQTAITISFDDEEFIIEYKSPDGKKYRIETVQEKYDALEIGDKVKAYYKISKTMGTFKWTGGFEKI